LNAYHWDGSGWGDPLTLDTSWGGDGRGCPGETSEPYSVRVVNVSDFSPFVLKSGDPPGGNPTVVTVRAFGAHSSPGATHFGSASHLWLALAALGAVGGMLLLWVQRR
jgi:hypothetical protein